MQFMLSCLFSKLFPLRPPKNEVCHTRALHTLSQVSLNLQFYPFIHFPLNSISLSRADMNLVPSSSLFFFLWGSVLSRIHTNTMLGHIHILGSCRHPSSAFAVPATASHSLRLAPPFVQCSSASSYESI